MEHVKNTYMREGKYIHEKYFIDGAGIIVEWVGSWFCM